MKNNKKPLVFTRGERIAIISVMLVVVILVLLNIFMPSIQGDLFITFHNLDSLIQRRQIAVNQQRAKERSSLFQADNAESRLNPFPFNPNSMSESDWQRLGLTERQIRGIMNYKAKGGTFYTKKDFKKLYSISEEEYAVLEPYIVIPVAEGRGNVAKSRERGMQSSDEDMKSVEDREKPLVDINLADSVTFERLPRVGCYMAQRVLAYRRKLGGYLNKEQLREVKGMDSARYEAIAPYVILEGNFIPDKLDVNRSDFKTLLNHPYLDYEMVKTIVRYRESRGFIKDWRQLLTILGSQHHPNPALEHYLKY